VTTDNPEDFPPSHKKLESGRRKPDSKISENKGNANPITYVPYNIKDKSRTSLKINMASLRA
jgi:hypothetical protein